MSLSQKFTFWKKKCPKIKKTHFFPILQTWNAANDVIVFVWVIHSLGKNSKRCNVKKSNSNPNVWNIQIESKIKSTTK